MNKVWLLQGSDMFCELFATKELALASLLMKYSDDSFKYEFSKIDGISAGIAITQGGEQKRFVLGMALVNQEIVAL